jgi:GDPmannose 4,6-dehydratase
VNGGRALVTGAGGQDGGYLLQQLLEQGREVHALVRDAAAVLPEGAVRHVGDVRDPELFPALLRRCRPAVVHHLAALSSVAASWQEPALAAEVNGLAAVRLLQACSRADEVPRVVLASSAEVFAATASTPQDESTPVAPASPYGASKATALLAARVHRAAGLPVSAALLYNHESPRRPAAFVSAKIVQGAVDIAAGAPGPLRLGNLDAVRDWGWAPDHVDAMVRMADAPPDDYVVATGQGRTVREFVEAVFAAAGLPGWQAHVVLDEALVRPSDAAVLVGDASRARQVLGWRPTVGFEELVARLVAARRAGRELPQG